MAEKALEIVKVRVLFYPSTGKEKEFLLRIRNFCKRLRHKGIYADFVKGGDEHFFGKNDYMLDFMLRIDPRAEYKDEAEKFVRSLKRRGWVDDVNIMSCRLFELPRRYAEEVEGYEEYLREEHRDFLRELEQLRYSEEYFSTMFAEIYAIYRAVKDKQKAVNMILEECRRGPLPDLSKFVQSYAEAESKEGRVGAYGQIIDQMEAREPEEVEGFIMSLEDGIDKVYENFDIGFANKAKVEK